MAKYVKTEEGYISKYNIGLATVEEIVSIASATSTAKATADTAQATADLKMNADNPVGTGSFSMGRKEGSFVGENSHAEGFNTEAFGKFSHAEGSETRASGWNSHAEGNRAIASGANSHAEGYNTGASGDNSHAEGYDTGASGLYSHAEGRETTAAGWSSHAEGNRAIASGANSHAEGISTKASKQCQHVQGQYNIIEDIGNADSYGKYAHIVGNGTGLNERSNAHTLDWSGNAWFAGDVYVGSTSGTNKDDGSKKLATEDYVNNNVDTTLTQSGKAADAAEVGARLSSLSGKKVDKAALGLIIGADGKIYVAINGAAIGSGVEITGGTVEDPTYKVELSDGIILTTLMFQDEFDGDSLSSVWKHQIGQNEAAMNCAFSALSENIAVEYGKLRMTVLKNNPTSDYPYSGARIMSQTFGGADNYGFDTGYAEIRFMLDNPVPGVSPAFWTVGQSQSEVITPTGDYTATRVIHGRPWPWAGEIDILEGYGDDNGSYFSPGIIYQTDPYTDAKQTGKTNTRNDYAANEWHTVGLYKSKDALKFYYDRALVATLDISDNSCFSGVGLKIILNLATGSTWGTIPDDFQQCNMYVDYVRVYSLSNSMSTLADQNTESLLPDCVNGFACVANRSWLLRPQFAENTKNTALYWESDNTGIAKVENGYVTTVSNGDCNITAKDPDGNTVINFALNVKDNAGILATGITVTSDITTIEAGGSADISANIYPENCDELIPTVTVITGSEYCSVDGLTVTNTNSSGEDKSIVVRVATNNPNVYEDITLTMATGVSFEVSIADGLTNNFQPKQEYIDTASDPKYLIWADSIADDKLYYAQDVSAFDGVKIVKSNTIDTYKLIYNTVFLNGSTEGTFISVLSNIAAGSGWGYVNTVDDIANETKVGHYAGVYFSSASNARCRLMPEDGNHSAVWQANIGFTSGELLVVVGKIDNGNIEYSLYNASGQIGTTGSKSIAEVVNDSGVIGGVYLGSSNRGNGIKGNIHQHLVYSRVLTDTEISTIASELIALHSGNV